MLVSLVHSRVGMPKAATPESTRIAAIRQSAQFIEVIRPAQAHLKPVPLNVSDRTSSWKCGYGYESSMDTFKELDSALCLHYMDYMGATHSAH